MRNMTKYFKESINNVNYVVNTAAEQSYYINRAAEKIVEDGRIATE